MTDVSLSQCVLCITIIKLFKKKCAKIYSIFWIMSLVFNSMPVILLHYRIFRCSLRLKLSFVISSEQQMIIFIFIKSKMVCHVVTMHFIVTLTAYWFYRYLPIRCLIWTQDFSVLVHWLEQTSFGKLIDRIIINMFRLWFDSDLQCECVVHFTQQHFECNQMCKLSVVIHAFHLCPSKVELASENKNGDY